MKDNEKMEDNETKMKDNENKMKDNDCIGGFTMNSWSSPDFWECKSDKKAIIFNLTKQRLFPCKNHARSIVCDRDFGPNFGWGELEAKKDPFDSKKSFKSRANQDHYKIPLDDNGIN